MNSVKRYVPLYFALSLSIVSGAASDALKLSGKPAPFLIDISDRPIPKLENGFVVSFHPDLRDVWLFDQHGNRVRDLLLSVPPPYVSVIRIGGAAASKDGRVAIDATATTDDGKTAHLIAWFDSKGTLQKIVRTTPFASHQIAFDTDGRLWAVGNLYNEQGGRDIPPHDVVRQYDVDGLLLRTFLPNVSFHTRQYPAAGVLLRAADGKMAIYFEPTKEWVEITNSGELLGRWPVPVPASARVTGVALTSLGDVFFTAAVPDGKKDRKPVTYRFNKQAGTLVQLDTSNLGESYPILLGADGERLAVFGQRPFKIISAFPGTP